MYCILCDLRTKHSFVPFVVFLDMANSAPDVQDILEGVPVGAALAAVSNRQRSKKRVSFVF